MIKHYLLSILTLIVMMGCDRERLVDVSTPDSMAQKDILFIFPSIPQEFCYADRMTVILDDFAEEMNLTGAQMLSTESRLGCENYGFYDCQYVTTDTTDDTSAIMCVSDTSSKACLYMLGIEYKDAQNNTFEETCIMGINK